MQRIEARFPQEDLETFDRMLKTISEELMPECDILEECKRRKRKEG